MSEENVSQSSAQRIYLQIYDYETKEFSGLTTYHGLVRIYNSNTWPSRIFWCVVVLSCLSLFMIHSGYLLLGYHAKPTLFQVNTIVPNDGLLFPDITICNYNPIMKSKLHHWNMSSNVLKYVLESYSESLEIDPMSLSNYEDAFTEYKQKFRENNEREFDLVEFFRNTSPTCDDLILSCSYGGRVIKDCCKESQFVMTDLGQCIRFSNEFAKRRQWFSGSGYGFQFILDGKNSERVDVLPSVFSDLGVSILIHETGKQTSPRSQGVSIPPGEILYSGIDTRNISLLKRTDWGMCQPGWQSNLTLIPNVQYTSTHCEWECMSRLYSQQCGCVPLSITFPHNQTVCTPALLHKCNQMTILPSVTDCSCSVECNHMEYVQQLSYARIGLLPHINKTDEYIEENISIANIFMRSISYERREQQKQLQTADLLSNIAGSMGLFLGMSTVTLLEIFIYLFKSVWGTVNTERQKQFMDAMIEEENERRPSLVLVEDVIEEQPDGAPPTQESLANRRMSRKVSLAPVHINMDRRGSRMLPGNLFANDLMSPRRSVSVAPQFMSLGPRKSIAIGMGHRGSQVESAGEILPGRRGSVVPPNSGYRPSISLAVPSSSGGRRLSVQHGDDAIHLQFVNRGRRKSSVNPKNFLI